MMRTLLAVAGLLLVAAAAPAQIPPMPSPVPQLRELLTSADPAVRLTAAAALGEASSYDYGLPHVAAVPDLLRVLADDTDEGVAGTAALALAALGPWPLGACEFTATCLDEWARAGAPAATIARLRAALRDVTKCWPGRAIVPDLADLMRVPGCERGALAALAGLGDDAHAATAAIDALLGGASPDLRWRAAFALACVGGAHAPSLRAARTDEHAAVRLWALRALPGEATADEIAPWLGDERPLARRWAIDALARRGTAARPFAERLVPLLLDAATWPQALAAFDRLGSDAAAAAPALARALADPNTRRAVLQALAAIGPAAAEAAGDALAQIVTQRAIGGPAGHEREYEIQPAIAAFARVDPARAVALLWPGFTAPQASPVPDDWLEVERFCALEAAAAAKLPELRRMLANGSRSDRLRALRVLGRMGAATAGAVAELRPLLRSDDLLERHEAMRAIVQSGPAAAVAMAELEAVYDRFPGDWHDLVVGLSGLGAAAEPLLLRGLATEDEWTRRLASVQLARLPVLSEKALQALRASPESWALEAYAQRRWPALCPSMRNPSIPWVPGLLPRDLLHLLEAWRPASGIGDRTAFLDDEARLTEWTIEFADRDDETVRGAVAHVLGKLPPTPAALATLQELTADPAPNVRCLALLALGRPECRAALPALARAWRSEEWLDRAAASVALRAALPR